MLIKSLLRLHCALINVLTLLIPFILQAPLIFVFLHNVFCVLPLLNMEINHVFFKQNLVLKVNLIYLKKYLVYHDLFFVFQDLILLIIFYVLILIFVMLIIFLYLMYLSQITMLLFLILFIQFFVIPP